MPKISHACVIALLSCAASTAVAAGRTPWPSTLPVYDHIVIVVEENKDFEQILGGKFDAPYIRKLAAEGAIFDRMVHLRPQACALDQLRERSQRNDDRHLVQSAVCGLSQRLRHAADRRLRHPELESRHAQWQTGSEHPRWRRLAPTEPRQLSPVGKDSQQSSDRHC